MRITELTELALKQRDARGRFVRVYSAQTRAAVRTEYENTTKLATQICEEHEVPSNTLYRWILEENWVRRQPRSIDTSDLLGRMLGLLEQQTIKLEIAMNDGTTEVAMLSKIVSTLDKVLLLKERVVRTAPRSSKRADALRAKIAERLVELNRA